MNLSTQFRLSITLFIAAISFPFLATAASADAVPKAKEPIRMSTTTSTDASGLLDYLLPKFTQFSGYEVQALPTGSGLALAMGERGDVDIMMTHAPAAQAEFVAKGYGVMARDLMYNDFVILGPKDDPAQVQSSTDISDALAKIAQSNSLFISRGDDSGTNMKELELWQQAHIKPEFSHYNSVGQGMGSTLNMTSELQGYTLADRGTWLAYQNKLDLKIVLQGQQGLLNPYQVIIVNPKRYPNNNYQGAKIFSDWLVSPVGQQLINDFTINGKQLFVANAKQ